MASQIPGSLHPIHFVREVEIKEKVIFEVKKNETSQNVQYKMQI